jgi:hypothetical protein
MSTHLVPTHRFDHENPASFLIVAGAILTALVILIALAVAAVVAFGVVTLGGIGVLAIGLRP